MSGQESKYERESKEEFTFNLYINNEDDRFVDTEGKTNLYEVNESKMTDLNPSFNLEDLLSSPDLFISEETLILVQRNFELLTKYMLMVFGSSFRHKIMAVNAWKIIIIDSFNFSDIFFNNPDFLKILFDGFFRSKINSLISSNFHSVLSQLVTTNSSYLTNYYSNNSFIRQFLYDNIRYDGILDIIFICLDTVNIFLSLPSVDDSFSELIDAISKIDDYSTCQRFISLIRAILARGSWNSTSYVSPVCCFFQHIIDDKQMNAIFELLINSNNEYTSLVMLSYIDKLTNYDIDDKIISFTSQETPYYCLPFISNKDRKSFTIDNNIKSRLNNDLQKYLSDFISRNLLDFLKEKSFIIPYSMKYIYTILDHLLTEVDLTQMINCYVVYISLYPYMVGYNFPLLASYCLDIYKKIHKYRNSLDKSRIDDLIKLYTFDTSVISIQYGKSWMDIFRKEAINLCSENNDNY